MLYVLVGPDGKVYDVTACATGDGPWGKAAPYYTIPAPRRFMGVINRDEARRLGWRVRKCHIVVEEE